MIDAESDLNMGGCGHNNFGNLNYKFKKNHPEKDGGALGNHTFF